MSVSGAAYYSCLLPRRSESSHGVLPRGSWPFAGTSRRSASAAHVPSTLTEDILRGLSRQPRKLRTFVRPDTTIRSTVVVASADRARSTGGAWRRDDWGRGRARGGGDAGRERWGDGDDWGKRGRWGKPGTGEEGRGEGGDTRGTDWGRDGSWGEKGAGRSYANGGMGNEGFRSEGFRNEGFGDERFRREGFRNHYVTLGVPRGASKQEIKAAFRRLARKCHPDVAQQHHSTQTFRTILAAYEVLSDEQQRRQYDFTLAAQDPPTSSTFPSWGQHSRFYTAPATTAASPSSAASAAYSGASTARETTGDDWWVPPDTAYRPRSRTSTSASASSAASSSSAAAGTAGAAAADSSSSQGAADSAEDQTFFRWRLNYSQLRQRAAQRRSARTSSSSSSQQPQSEQQQQEQGPGAGSWEQWNAPDRHTKKSQRHSDHDHSYSRPDHQSQSYSRSYTKHTHPRQHQEQRGDEWGRARWQQQDEETASKHPFLEPFTLPLSFSEVFLGSWLGDIQRFALFRIRSLFPGGLRSFSSSLSLLFALFLLVSCAAAFGSERLLGVLTFALMWGNQRGFQIAGIAAWYLGGVRGLVLVVGLSVVQWVAGPMLCHRTAALVAVVVWLGGKVAARLSISPLVLAVLATRLTSLWDRD